MRTVSLSLILFAFSCTFSKASSAQDEPAGPLANTFINPLPLPDYPLGNWTQKPSPNLDRYLKGVRQDFRELADPSVIYHEGKWIMYSSVRMAYVSTDFIHWTYQSISPEKIGDGYAPTVVKSGNRFLMTGCFSELYTADNPLGPFTSLGPIKEPGGAAIDKFIFDPMLFSDDDGKLYLYYHAKGQLLGTRLDAANPVQMETVPKELAAYKPEQVWERYGEYNEDPRRNFMEGVWMLKRNDTYYLTFTGPGTSTGTYAIGAYKSKSPLGSFTYQKNNPVLRKTFGVVPGSGHGSIVAGPNNTLWAFVTSVVGNYHVFERRVGLYPIGFDKNGDLTGFASRDIPQFAPGTVPHPENGNETGWLPVNVRTIARASSSAPGRTPDYAIDDNARTWWQPEAADTAAFLTIDLKMVFDIAAVRILWSEAGLDHEKGILPAPVRYKVQYQDGKSEEWKTALDRSNSKTDMLVDYRSFNTVSARRVRLQLLGLSPAAGIGVQEFTVFGKPPVSTNVINKKGL